MSADTTPHWKVYLCANCGESNYHAWLGRLIERWDERGLSR